MAKKKAKKSKPHKDPIVKRKYVRSKIGAKKFTPAQYIKAIRGTGGVLSRIAKKLGTQRATVSYALSRRAGEQWDLVREMYQDECMAMVDLAETAVHEILKQKKDLPLRQKSAHWFLERRHEDYGNKKEIKLEGSMKVASIQRQIVSVDDLDLPLAVRQLLLTQLDQVQEPEEDEQEED